MKHLAVVRIRGQVGVRKNIKDTLDILKLMKIGNCVIVDDRESYKGMLQKAKDYITFGEVDSEVMKKLLLKWGRLQGDKRIDEEYVKEKTGLDIDKFIKSFFDFEHDLSELELKKVFRLHPPRGGYKNIKKGFHQGGSLGYRGEKINVLLEKMI